MNGLILSAVYDVRSVTRLTTLVSLEPAVKIIREFVYGPKVRRGQVILSGLDLAFTKYFAGNCEQDPWPTKY